MSSSISPSLENYLRMILQLQQDGYTARITDLAEKLNIAKSSVNQAVGTLKKQGLVRHERYGPLELTDKGVTTMQQETGREIKIADVRRRLKEKFSEVFQVELHI